MQESSLDEIVGGDKAFVMVCEDLQDPGNLGTIIRTGEGAGISDICDFYVALVKDLKNRGF